jgi:phenolic acid decarboxylase
MPELVKVVVTASIGQLINEVKEKEQRNKAKRDKSHGHPNFVVDEFAKCFHKSIGLNASTSQQLTPIPVVMAR